MPEDTASVGFVTVTPAESLHNTTNSQSLPRCPICRARLLEFTTCPRCGTDLSLSLQIARNAYDLERVAVAHLLSGEWALAKAVLVNVQRLRSSELSGQLLAFVAHQLMESTCLPDTHSTNVEPVAEVSTLATLDLSIIERYG